MQLLLQPVNWTALTLQSTVPDKARESWQQQLDLEAANLYFLTSVQRLKVSSFVARHTAAASVL